MGEYKLPEILRKTIDGKNVTVKAIVKDTGLTGAQISNYSHGKNVPSAQVLFTLSNYLGVSADYLLTGGKPVDHGSWIYRGDTMQCNRCLREYKISSYNYCPYCGRDMRDKG